jgi:hypothetical protein
MPSALTEDQINTMIQAIYTQKLAMITSPQPSYKVGEYEWKWNEYMAQLDNELKTYQTMLASLPAEETTLPEEWM